MIIEGSTSGGDMWNIHSYTAGSQKLMPGSALKQDPPLSIPPAHLTLGEQLNLWVLDHRNTLYGIIYGVLIGLLLLSIAVAMVFYYRRHRIRRADNVQRLADVEANQMPTESFDQLPVNLEEIEYEGRRYGGSGEPVRPPAPMPMPSLTVPKRVRVRTAKPTTMPTIWERLDASPWMQGRDEDSWGCPGVPGGSKD